MVIGTNWGFAISNDFDRKGRNRGAVARKWEATRRKAYRGSGGIEQGLTGPELDAAVMAMAVADPSLVGFGPREERNRAHRR